MRLVAALQILFVADGAEWIWKHIPDLFSRLNCNRQTLYLLDFYHATEHLQTFAEAAFKQEQELKSWFKTARSQLKHGQINSLINSMNSLIKSARGSRRQIMKSQINYFNKANERSLLNYSKIQALNLPIGSGAIESLIRQAVNLRIKGNGKFWLPENAESILHARCQWLAGNWNNFCNSILTSRINPASS